MSSAASRQAIVAAVVAAASPVAVKDLSDYITLSDALPNDDSQVVLVQFVVSGEEVQTIGSPGNQGWEEDGTVVLHLMVPNGSNSATAVALGDTIREALRGTRHGAVTIESCSPFTDFSGALGHYPEAWKGWASNLFYVRRDCG